MVYNMGIKLTRMINNIGAKKAQMYPSSWDNQQLKKKQVNRWMIWWE